ncbi:MAG: Orotidine 5'-phosphate decarboxylase, partial [uncultured Thermomicrobiales bacterium]
MTGFTERLAMRAEATGSLVCINLDPDLDRPGVSDRSASPREAADAVVRYFSAVIERTAPYACAYKPNFAFFLPLGADGIRALREIRERIPREIPVILDAKVGDVGNTSEHYAQAFFDTWDFDAVTVNPYLGEDGLAPFFERADRGVIVLAKTSNPGSGDFQDLALEAGSEPLSDRVVRRVVEWDQRYPAAAGLVVGATYPGHLARIRRLAPTLPILLPGVGAQGGDVAASVRAGCDATGGGLLVSAGRSIIYAGTGAGFADA